MTSRLGLRLLALALPTALLLPAGAHAATLTVEDGAGDAKALNLALVLGEMFDGTTPPDEQVFLDAPAETTADVVRTTIDHAEKRLTLTVQFRDLVDTAGHSVEFRIFTPDGKWVLYAGMAGDRARAELSPSRFTETYRLCRTVRARYDLAADTLTASVPTSCIESPKWVQVAAGVTREKVTPQGDGSVNLAGYVDDAFRGGVSLESLGRSPKVRRG